MKHFTQKDLIIRSVSAIRNKCKQQFTKHAKRFLQELLAVSPIPIRSIQVDGDSEFMYEFEDLRKEDFQIGRYRVRNL